MSRGPNVIQRLRILQKRDGWLTEKGLKELSLESDTPVHELFGVASFYPEFHLSEPPRVTVRVCTALPCQMRGSELMVRALEKKAKDRPDVRVNRAPCLGACERAPVVIVNEHIQTCHHERTAKDIVATVDAAIAGTAKPKSYPPHGIRGPFKTDPYNSPDEHFGTVKKLLQSGDMFKLEKSEKPVGNDKMYPIPLIRIEQGNLRGMGGAGAPAMRKWSQVYEQKSDEKFVVANADESEPGTLKDREIMRNLPHLVCEGMIIAGLALGAQQGYIYLRHEYEEQHEALEHALKRAREMGVLGENIMGSGKTFNLEVYVSPGGYVLGECTALLEALEGKRGQPRNGMGDFGEQSLPSFHGLWGKPTLVNNIETYVYVPVILAKGPEWFKAQGVNGSQGLKFASVCGDVVHGGVFEIPMGTTFGELIEKAGGVKGGWENFKAFAPSGPSFGFRPLTDIDCKMDFPEKRKKPADPAAGHGDHKGDGHGDGHGDAHGDAHHDTHHVEEELKILNVGSGAVIVLDKSRCMVDAAINFTRFFRNESCGKCVPCRVGSQQLVNLIRSVRGVEGQNARDTAHARDALTTVDRLNDVLYKASICGLGKVVPVPLDTVRKYWPEELEMHIKTGTCGAATCPVVKRGQA
jgi:NADH:ubiquinone oxidoreductase subunit F (NADH-binding)/NADH:ubiquinone oxidoreductase subunit E